MTLQQPQRATRSRARGFGTVIVLGPADKERAAHPVIAGCRPVHTLLLRSIWQPAAHVSSGSCHPCTEIKALSAVTVAMGEEAAGDGGDDHRVAATVDGGHRCS